MKNLQNEVANCINELTITSIEVIDTREIIEMTENHRYIVESYTFHEPDGESIGYLKLLNICTGEYEDYSIWIGDDDLSWFYVCLPTGEETDDEDILEVYNFDIFDIPIEHYRELKWSN